MAQEMSFAQALTEARQIIVQQSNRIKGDLDRIKAMQETIAAQTGTIAGHDRMLHERASQLEEATGQVRELTAKLEETRTAKEQAEGVCDRQGQRLTQLQESVATLDRQAGEQAERLAELKADLDATRSQVPTAEDTEALMALSTLLAAKKGGSPVATAAVVAA